jgi:hypothetical protein
MLLLTGGCFLRVATPPRPLSRQQAIEVGVLAARQHGYRIRQVSDAGRDDEEWKVVLMVAPPLHGSIRIAVDAWTGSVLRFDELRSEHGRHHDDEDDEEKDEHRHHEDDD